MTMAKVESLRDLIVTRDLQKLPTKNSGDFDDDDDDDLDDL